MNKQYRKLTAGLVIILWLQLLVGLFYGLPEPTRAAGPSFVRATGDRLTLNGQAITLKGSSFFPLGRAFSGVWDFWDSNLVRQSLQRAHDLGENTVRAFVLYGSDFGWTKSDSGEVQPVYLDMLKQFLQLASSYNMRVIVTLFDQVGFARPGTREETNQRQYLHDIVTALRDDDRILAWDLHNEPDNYPDWSPADYPNLGLTWLYRMNSYLRSLDPNHLITIGVGQRPTYFQRTAEGYNMLDMMDFVSMHSYNVDALSEEIYEMQQTTKHQKPIIIEETGWPTGPVFAPDFTEDIQVAKYQKTLKIARDMQLCGVLQWVLYDIDPIGSPPWDDIGNYYGLIRRNDTPKPAAAVWQNDYRVDPLPPAGTVTNLPLTVRPPDPLAPHFLPQADHSLGTPIWEYWRRSGATSVYGYPLTDTFLAEDIGSGRHRTGFDLTQTPVYQWFEKGRVEYHRERLNDPHYKGLEGLEKYFYLIDMGNVGTELAAARGYNFPRGRNQGSDSDTYQWFDYTGHSLQEPFLSFWRDNHGSHAFGMPISEPFEETNPDTGQRRLIQYFEKARLEYRPEWADTHSAVVVGNVGTELLKLKGWLKPGQLSPSDVPANPVMATADYNATQAGDNPPQPQTSFADPAFQKTWQRTDQPVADGSAGRTWLWGPQPFAVAHESYQQAPGGQRLVEYFDKTRMELTNPGGDKNSKWYVTNGLLVREMISGQVQVGANQFLPNSPAQIPLAGDPAAVNPAAPTYASLQNLITHQESDHAGQAVSQSLDQAGQVGAAPANLSSAVRLAKFVPETGHNVPDIFSNFLTNTRGPVVENGQTVNGDVIDWLFSTGLPISEPYWTRARVGGVEKDVLIQAFERRVLTYTPTNPAAFQVEMGNVGQHYYQWRYGSGQPAPAQSDGGLPLDSATRQELDQAGGLAYRNIGPTSVYKYTSQAGETASAAILPGSSDNPGAPMNGPELVYRRPETDGQLLIHLNNWQGQDRAPAKGLAAALSPDHNRLAYVHYVQSGRLDLFIKNLATGQTQDLAGDVLPDLAWSPDGSKLIFYYRGENFLKIAVSENGGAPRVLFQTGNDTMADSPQFSPDGRRLAYTLYRVRPDDSGPYIGAAEVHLLDITNGQDQTVANNGARPVFSPDGSQVAWLGWNEPTLWALVNGAPQKIGPALACRQECANTGRPAFSPDGRWLVYTGPQSNLLVVRSSGGPAYALTPAHTSQNGQTPPNYERDPVWK